MKHSLQKRFHDFVLKQDLLRKGEKVLLAASGGLDSTVLATLFFEEKLPFAIAHCNFHLRGEESDGDEAFVIQWAESHGIDCYVKSFDLGDGSIQLEARNTRYAWFTELLNEHGISKIATAHHLNDSFETLLINLVRGTGIRGLEGIKVASERVIRPLLFATKGELRDFAKDKDLSWREDSSNSRTDYDRNQLRMEVIPLLEGLNPSLIDTYKLTKERLHHTAGLIEQQKQQIQKEHYEAASETLALNWIAQPSDLVLLAEILSEYGVNYATSREIFDAKGKAGKYFEIGDRRMLLDRDTLFLNVQETTVNDLESVELATFGMHYTTLGAFEIAALENQDLAFSKENLRVYLDADKVKLPFLVRRWQRGDEFVPLGMQGKKKVSDLLIDEKVPLCQKKDVLVVESNGEICWIPGLRTSEHFKVRGTSQQVIKLAYSSKD